MTFGVEFKQKRMFFDRANVVAQVGKRNAAFLSRVGAFTNQAISRSSLGHCGLTCTRQLGVAAER
jgi:hypothetical protein